MLQFCRQAGVGGLAAAENQYSRYCGITGSGQQEPGCSHGCPEACRILVIGQYPGIDARLRRVVIENGWDCLDMRVVSILQEGVFSSSCGRTGKLVGAGDDIIDAAQQGLTSRFQAVTEKSVNARPLHEISAGNFGFCGLQMFNRPSTKGPG